MKTDEILQFIEPVYRFCVKRLSNRHDAEDLASEIMVHVLSGMKKYDIDSLEKWIWRVAHNRYARFIDMRNRKNEVPSENCFADIPDSFNFVDEMFIVDEYQQIFKYLHTLSSQYRNIMVDYYIGQLPVKQIAKNYTLAETTVKWRLNISREKIRKRIGDDKMDKVYKRINWNTGSCNGSMDPNKYLYSQIARAICEAAYEKPLTAEEISLKTGLPTMYIEDELPRLINGDAIVQEGNKYATNFIVLRLCDKKVMETKFAPLVADISDYFMELFKGQENEISKMDFYGSRFTMKKLGYVALPAVLREKIREIKEKLNLQSGLYPPRLDGGYGWFIVDEKETENEFLSATDSGCNASGNNDELMYYFIIGKYYHGSISPNLDLLTHKKIAGKTQNGVIPDSALTEDDLVRLIKTNLVIKDGDKYKLNFAVFTEEQFYKFKKCFNKDNAKLENTLSELITDIHKSFKAFVPKRLESQINQWVSCYVHNIISFVSLELINRNILETPEVPEKPLTNGVFCILGKDVYV